MPAPEMSDVATEIEPRLWISGLPQWDWDLTEWGVGLIVTLCEHLPPQAARRFEWGTQGEAMGDGELIFLHWPIADGELPNLDHLTFVTDTVLRALHEGTKVLVHCYEGRNRSGLVAALCVRQLTGLSGAPLVERIQRQRRGALTNRNFAEYLRATTDPTAA